MEEKLYFKPASYGKGTKAKKPESEKPEKEPTHIFLKFGLIILVLVAIVLVIIYFLHGKTTTTSEKIPNVKSVALSCASDSFIYPIFVYDGSKSRGLEVKMIFSEEELKSISLGYSLLYDSADLVQASEAHNHAAMNISFGKNNLEADAYNAKYTILSDRMRMNLYAPSSKLDETAKLYFLIDGDGTFPKSVQELRKNYESQGFACEISE